MVGERRRDRGEVSVFAGSSVHQNGNHRVLRASALTPRYCQREQNGRGRTHVCMSSVSGMVDPATRVLA